MLFGDDGGVRAVQQREFQQFFPQSGWVEHDPMEIWQSQRRTLVDLLAGLEEKPAAVGITNQRETTILWDRASGEPLHPAIVWQDRRTADRCAALKAEGVEALIRAKTGLLLDPYFSGTKLAWLLDHVPDARARAGRGELAFGTVDSWLIWQLTEGRVHATDASNASRTMLYNLHSGSWDQELLQLLDIPPEVLPTIVSSSGVIAEVSGIPGLEEVPIAGVAGDQQAALFGQGCFEPGMAKNTYGTGCFMLMQTGTDAVASEHGLLTTLAWQIGEQRHFALEGAVFIAGALVQWLRDGLGIIDSASDIEALAERVPDSDGVVLVPAFAGLGAPHWDPHARGSILGLNRGSTRAHIARAALDAIAFQSAELLAAMQADAGVELSELRVDGGAAANDLLMQTQADVLQRRVVRPDVTETTALGAAALAGLAVGVWPGPAAFSASWAMDRAFEPKTDRQADRARWDRALTATRMF